MSFPMHTSLGRLPLSHIIACNCSSHPSCRHGHCGSGLTQWRIISHYLPNDVTIIINDYRLKCDIFFTRASWNISHALTFSVLLCKFLSYHTCVHSPLGKVTCIQYGLLIRMDVYEHFVPRWFCCRWHFVVRIVIRWKPPNSFGPTMNEFPDLQCIALFKPNIWNWNWVTPITCIRFFVKLKTPTRGHTGL